MRVPCSLLHTAHRRCSAFLSAFPLQTVGRLAQRVAWLLQGKHHPTYSPHIDSGDSVAVINASQIQFTGKRWQTKLYRHHTGRPGGLREIPALTMLQKHPTLIVRRAVLGMLHHNKFRVERMRRLRVYAGEEMEGGEKAQLPFDVRQYRQRLEAELQAEQLRTMGWPPDQALPMLTDEAFASLQPTNPVIRQRWKEQQESEAKQLAEYQKAEAAEQAKRDAAWHSGQNYTNRLRKK